MAFIGADRVSRKMIITVFDKIAPILLYLIIIVYTNTIFNNSFKSGNFPAIWKDVDLTSTYKIHTMNNRPISMLPFLAKVLERLVQEQLNSFICKHNIFNSLQSDLVTVLYCSYQSH